MELELFGATIAAWQFFVALGLIFITMEIFAPGFVMLPIGIAFLLTAALSTVVVSATAQWACFGVLLALVFVLFKKFVRKKTDTPTLSSNVDSLAGQIAKVSEAIEPSEGKGYVKLYGDTWRALCDQPIAAGTSVKITKVDGNKVWVEPMT